MPTISKSVELPAPPESVWAKLTDFGAYGEWNVTHVGFPDGAPTALDTSTSFKEKVKIMGMPGEVQWTVKRVEEGSALELDGKGPMGTHMRYLYELAAENGGTRLAVDSEFGGAALGPMEGALTKESEKALDESLAKFADTL
jgi:uncharacterized protein YndB with AHSA1/START domain